jgi:hypothetical protein
MGPPVTARLTLLGLVLSACAGPPTAMLVFAPLGDPDNCAASEAEIASGTASLWLGLRRDAVTIASACVPVAGATGWKDLEDALVDAGTLVADLPLGAPLAPFVMGLPPSEVCAATDPSGGIRFCARAEVAFVIDADDGGGRVEVRRICPATWSAQDCFDE